MPLNESPHEIFLRTPLRSGNREIHLYLLLIESANSKCKASYVSAVKKIRGFPLNQIRSYCLCCSARFLTSSWRCLTWRHT